MGKSIRDRFRQSGSRPGFYRMLTACDRIPPYEWIYNSRIKSRSRNLAPFPPELAIETTNLCNAQCTICAHPGMRRPKGRMESDLVRSLIEQAADARINKIYLSGFGEPLIDKRLPEFAAYANEKGINVIGIVTNGSLLNMDMASALVGAGLNEFTISIDGFTPNSYGKTRVGLDFDCVIENIRGLHDVLVRAGKRNEVKVFISAVNLVTNRNEQKIADDLLGKFADRIYFRQAQGWTANYGRLVAGYTPHYKPNNIPCRYLWDSMSVYIDGRVPACCLDNEARVSMGDATKLSVAEIWNGEKFNHYRQMHVDLLKSELSPCDSCGYYSVWW